MIATGLGAHNHEPIRGTPVTGAYLEPRAGQPDRPPPAPDHPVLDATEPFAEITDWFVEFVWLRLRAVVDWPLPHTEQLPRLSRSATSPTTPTTSMP